MSVYKTQYGDSPGIIAGKLRTTVGALLAANPHKPTTVVAGKQTWRGLTRNEILRTPPGVGGMLGAIAPADPMAPHAMIRRGSYGADVALWQTILGVTADGSFGPNTDKATRAWQSEHGVSADGVVGPNTWSAALGGLHTPAETTAPTVTPAAPSSSLAMAATAAVAALSADPNYCMSVGHVGTAVNTAVHNFKSAWNSANPSRPVPIGTGKYEVSVAAALWSTLGGQVTVPPGCGAATTTPQQPAPVPGPPTAGGPSSAQIAAATAMNSALTAHGYRRADQPLYAAFQRSMGLSADGYPGTGTMSALRMVLASSTGIPMASVPVYPWHSTGAYDGVNAPTAAQWTGAAAPSGGGGTTTPTGGGTTTPTTGGGTTTPVGACFNPDGTPTWACPPSTYTAWNAAHAGTTTPVATGGGTTTPATGGGTTPGGVTTGSIVTAPDEKKGLSKGAVVVGAIGAASLVGLIAMAAMHKKPGHRGTAGKRGARGPAKRKSPAKRSGAKRKKSKKR